MATVKNNPDRALKGKLMIHAVDCRLLDKRRKRFKKIIAGYEELRLKKQVVVSAIPRVWRMEVNKTSGYNAICIMTQTKSIY